MRGDQCIFIDYSLTTFKTSDPLLATQISRFLVSLMYLIKLFPEYMGWPPSSNCMVCFTVEHE